jgi:hypothetical protein
MNKIKKIFIFICSFILDILCIFIFKDIFYAKKIIIKYAINPFDICEKQPQLWNNIKLLFVFLLIDIITYLFYFYNILAKYLCIKAIS